MWKRSIVFVLSLMLGFSLLAKPGGGGSFSSSPSRSGSFSSRPSSPSVSRSTNGGSFSNKSAVATRPTQSSLAKVQQQNTMSTQAKESLTKFKTPAATPLPAPTAIKSSPVFGRALASDGRSAPTTYGTYLSSRTTYYSSYHPPVYVYNCPPRYGVWDAMFMWMMLDNMNSTMYYNHRNDMEYQQWRADANRQAQDNAELRAKLAAMDQQVQALKAANTPVDPAYMPPNVNPAVAMSVEAAEATLPKDQVQNEAVPEAQGDGWDDGGDMGYVTFWVLGILAGIGLTVWGISALINRRNAANSYSSRYRL